MKKDSNKQKITIPGFKFAGVTSGIKKSGEKDLAIIFSETPSVVAGLFTTNRIKAAPVKLSTDKLATQKKCQAVIVNSGNANACTGLQGLKDARQMISVTARELGIATELVYVSSTGIIGHPLPIKKITRAIPGLIEKLSSSSLQEAASAIMTTDTFAKISSRKLKIGSRTGTIAAISKGAGMVCPNMATMLCFIVTDIAVTQRTLDYALREAVNKSFNRISIDNDMSTNDTVMILSNGLLKNKPITRSNGYYKKFENALYDITNELAGMIVKDGEGATKQVELIVKGAKTVSDAERVAKSVANSMLVKTAIYGKDPNWGRIMAAIGYSGATINERKISVYLDKIKLVSKGTGTNREHLTEKIFKNKMITIVIDLGSGEKSARALTCDLTEKYVKINAHYTT